MGGRSNGLDGWVGLATLGGFTVWPGNPYPLGATYDGGGTNFAVFSEVAERVELCLFDDDGTETRVDLPERETTGPRA